MTDDGISRVRAISLPADQLLSVVVESVDQIADDRPAMGITLTLGGMVVSGTMIPEWEWLEGMGTDELSKASKERAQRRADLSRRDGNLTDEETEFMDGHRTDFIHLKDVLMLTGSGSVLNPAQPLVWRGRLSEISGWSYGVLTVSIK